MEQKKIKNAEDIEIKAIGYITPQGEILTREIPGATPFVDLSEMDIMQALADEKLRRMCAELRRKHPEEFAILERIVQEVMPDVRRSENQGGNKK